MIRTFYGYEDVSRRLWITSLTLIAFGGNFLLVGLFKNHYLTPLGLPLALGLFMVAWGYGTKIEANPPHVGLLTIWGKRIPVVIREGIWFFANFFPFYIWFIPVLVERSNYEIEFDALCKAEKMEEEASAKVKDSIGGTVNVKAAITLAPDWRPTTTPVGGERLIQFLNSGKMEGVIHILTEMVKEEVRDTALDFTWERFTELKAVLSAYLISLVTDKKVARLLRNDNGTPLSIKQLKDRGVTAETYDDFPAIDHLLDEYVATMGVDGGPENKECRDLLDADILFFLNVIVVAGVADVRDLGVIITKFNVTHIFPVGAIKEAADAAAAEKQQRTQEQRDTETDIDLAQRYVRASNDKISLEAALRIVRANRGRAKEVIITGGSGNPILDAAAIMKS